IMRKPSSRWILSTLALVGVAACTVVACGDDDTTDGSASSSGSSGTDGGGKDGSSSGAADGSSSGSSGNVSDTGAPTDGNTTDTGASGDSGDDDSGGNDSGGNDSGGTDSGSDADASKDAGPDADASKADADAATCNASGGNGGACDIQDGTYTLHFTSGVGSPACPLPADQQTPINHCQGSNEDAGANCQVTYDFVACKQTLHCVQTASGGGFTLTTTIDNVTTWTSTKITGTSHSVTTGGPVGVDCTYQYTLTKNP
ncbi:MAG: hypothetical protein U0270_46195, partial [Labilithrix sp.]